LKYIIIKVDISKMSISEQWIHSPKEMEWVWKDIYVLQARSRVAN
jgi:hypothetical protein